MQSPQQQTNARQLAVPLVAESSMAYDPETAGYDKRLKQLTQKIFNDEQRKQFEALLEMSTIKLMYAGLTGVFLPILMHAFQTDQRLMAILI